MGLLDNLYFGHANPNFGGPGGGLLDFLRTTQMQQENYKPSAGFPDAQPSPLDTAQWPHGPMGAPSQAMAQTQANPISVGDYQMPRMGNPDLFQPQHVNIPPAAQPAQGQMPQQQLGNEGGLAAGFRGFANNLHTGLLGSIVGGIGSALGMQNPGANQTAQFLVSKGLDPALARKVVADPMLLRAVLPQMIVGVGQTEDIKEFERAQKDPAFAKYMESKRAGAGEVGLNPVWGEDEKGNPVIGQLSKKGEFVRTKLPPGVSPSKGVDKVDMGTEWGVISKVNGQLVGKYPKNIEAREEAEKVGAARGTAKVALPAAETTTNRAVRMLDELEKHPGFSDGVGFIVGRLPALTPKAADFRERVEQMDAMVFGDAVEVMRGLGALTDKEGPRITAARARLKTAKSEDDFRTALKDIREVFKDGIENMRRKAGQSAAPAETSTPAVVDYRTYFGKK